LPGSKHLLKKGRHKLQDKKRSGCVRKNKC